MSCHCHHCETTEDQAEFGAAVYAQGEHHRALISKRDERIAELEADKARLDWLTNAMRERRTWMVVHPVAFGKVGDDFGAVFDMPEFLREAIDAARGEGNSDAD